MVLGLAITAVAFWYAGRRAMTLFRLGRTGQPADPDRTRGIGARVWAELAEVLGQRKLFKWTVPGLAHALTFWGFLVLALTLIEGYGALFQRDFHIPFPRGAFASEAVAKMLKPLGRTANDVIETAGLLVALGIVLAFLVLVMHSKHLHIFTAPFNVAFSRRPLALGALLPVYSGGKPVDFEDPGEDDKIGRGAIEDFSWKGLLDFATCTECGRCQSQCPAWNTDKPLSPKLVIMDLRDHALAKAPYLLATDKDALSEAVKAEADRPLVGGSDVNGVIHPDVLWSCTTCGACVEQCPVDIEHVDHIVDMRRYQVMIESEFPPEAGVMLRNLEHSGDPWGVGARGRLSWTEKLPFEVPVVDGSIPDDVEYLFWVGCAGALDNRGQRTTKAVAELLHEAGVKFAVLGSGETCTGDPARRIANEYP